MNYLQKVENAKQLIGDYVKRYPKIALGCSFGKDSMVILDIARLVKPDIEVFAVLADTEFPETYAFAKEAVKKYRLKNYREYLFTQEPGGKCCGTPKVEKFREALLAYDAWISGVRNTEGITRANFKPVDDASGFVKINPILLFTERDIWRYTALNRVLVNPMYGKGYRSLGCKLCSSPEKDESESEREGRWLNDPANHGGECGIHTQLLR